MTGVVLRSLIWVREPRHLSLDSEGHLLVADPDNGRIMLLNSQLELQRVLIDSNPQVRMWYPRRHYYNEQASILYIYIYIYVIYDSNSRSSRRYMWSGIISMFNTRKALQSNKPIATSPWLTLQSNITIVRAFAM